MHDVDMPAHRMTRVHVPLGGTLVIEVQDMPAAPWGETHPMARELLHVCAFVNRRFAASATRIAVAFVEEAGS